MSYSYLQTEDNNDIRDTYPPAPSSLLSLGDKERYGSRAEVTKDLDDVRVYATDPNPLAAVHEKLPYERGNRTVALLGLIISFFFGMGFITVGVVIYVVAPQRKDTFTADNPVHWNSATERTLDLYLNHNDNIVLGLVLNALVTICTEATGHVHGTTLKWALADEGRLPFNGNLRLFRSARGAFSINGWIVNLIFAITTVMSYAASSSILLRASISRDAVPSLDDIVNGTVPMVEFTVMSYVPPILLGAALLTQAILSIIAFFNVKVLTWSSNPLDVASALRYNGYVNHVPNRCMRSVADADNDSTEPIRPSKSQRSASGSHRLVRHVSYFVWVLPAGSFLFGGVLMGFGGSTGVSWTGGAPPIGLLWGSFILGSIQSVITLCLHCCELVTTLSKDEVVWRQASRGRKRSSNALIMLVGSWQCVVLLIAKTMVHWVYGLAASMAVGEGVTIWGGGLFELGAGTMLVAIFVTFVSLQTPKGPQPAAYGHVQTLVDLVDEWSPKMYWGHKADGAVCHAGTSSEPLPPVQMDAVYARQRSG